MKEVKQNKKIVALITLITLIANMFFPYCSLISYAGVDLDMPYLELANGYDEMIKNLKILLNQIMKILMLYQ